MKKFLSFLLAIITMAGSFAAFPANTAYASTEASVNGIFRADLQVQSEASRQVTVVLQGDSPLGPSFKGDEPGATLHRKTYPINIIKDGGEGTAAYCITPFARGASPSGEPQTLDSVPYTELNDLDKKLLGIMMAGYPTNSHGKSASEAYMATQLALQHFVYQHSDRYPNPKGVYFNDDSWSHWEQLPILELAKTIYNQGINNPYSPESATVGVDIEASNEGKFTEVGDNLEMTLKINIDGTFTKGKLTFDSFVRDMIKSNPNCKITVGSRMASFEAGILGADDYDEGIKVLPGETQVKITLSKSSAESYMDFQYSGDAKNGSYSASKEVGFTFAVVGGSAKQAYLGKNRNTKNQDYIFFAPGETQPIQQKLFMATSDIWEFEEEPGSGGLKIAKYNKKTNTLVAGAIFEIRGVSMSNRDFLVQIQASPGATLPLPNGGTAITGVGTIELQNIPAGEYQITELSPPPNFDYCDFGINSQVVTVTAGVESGFYPQVRFENNPYASLKIRKIDAVTGSPVNGAILRVRNAIANIDVELTTMNGGIIELKNLPQGNYEISEVYAPEGYVISTEKKTATLRWGETTDITFENTPKTELLVKKIDGETGAVLDGAVFRLTKPDTGDTWEDVTFFDGYAVFLDIPAGTYVLEETKAPQGYILDSTKRTIVVQNYKSNEVIIQNFKKPTLVILKVDEDTAQPLPNAEFRVAKMSGQVIYEGITDANGTIKLDNLTSEWYKITEIAAPKGYLIATETKDVFFEPNQVLEVKFDNRRRPTLEILKVDEQTNEPLAGAVFHVRKTEDSTVSEYITGADGKITIIDLDEAIYSVVEVKSPDGYLLDPQHKDIQLEWGKVKQLVFTNKARPALRILKVDAVTGKPLVNAEFRVTKVEDKTVSEYITDATGEILIKNLDEAIYKVEEFMPPDGYILYDESKEIALEWGQTKTLKFDNIRKPTLIVTKLNGLTNNPVPGATYKVEYEAAGGGVVTLGSYLTDANGQIAIPKVNAGWYIVTETKAAPGFSLPSNPVTRIYLSAGENAYLSEGISTGTESGSYDGDFTVLSGNDFTPTLNATGDLVYNWPLNSVVIKKTHAVTGELLAGAAFELYRADEQVSGVPGTNVGRFTTDNSGVIVITGLEPGYYVVKEVQAPQNFLISENSMQNGFLKADGTTVLEFAFANYPYGSILITKVDAQTNKPLANARFRVTDGSGAVLGNSNGEFITDENGEIIIPNVKPDSYVVTEIEAPEHYTIETTPQTVNVGTDGKTYKVSFKNQPAGEIVIRKLDFVSKEPLAGAEFKVTDSTGAVVGTGNGIFRTDATGTVKIPNLPKGSYVLEEIVAPTGYILENQTQTVAVDYGKTYTIDFYNKKMSGLQIIKIDSVTKQPLKGAEFTVYKQNGEIVDRYVTDADGVIIIGTLTPGWYKIVETKTLDGYLLDETPKDVEITANQFVKVVFENAPMSGLIIRKVDADTRDPLSGAEFTVKKADGLLIGIYRSGTDGIASVGLLEPGWYTVTETKSPDGYTLGDNVQTIEITNTKTVTIEFQNRAFGSLVIKKVDEITGDPLTGAEFTVSKQGGAFVGEYTTGKDGTISIPNVEPGWYVVSEKKAPTGYTLDSTAKTVEVKPVVPTVTTFTNKALTTIEIIKTDSVTNLPLAGATFKVERPNGEVIGIYKTDVSGKSLVTGLTEGTYIVSETIAPDGYHLNEMPKTVVVTSGKVTTVEFANNPYSGIQILKTDVNTNAPLKGAVFTIQRVNGERVGDKYTTDIAGKIVVSDLAEGTYIISEIQAPADYVLDAQPQTVEVKSGRLTIAEFVNTPYPYLHIVKTDASTGQLLSGAEFVVTNAYGEIIANVTSQATGAVSLKVAPGVYTVTEVKAPAGYENNAPVQTVEVRANGTAVYYGTSIAYPNNTAAFANRPLNAIQILKLDSITHNPLSKALFMVEKSDGTRIGSFLTDSAGSVLISSLTEGTYIIKEISAPNGYQLDETPKTISVSGGRTVNVDFINKPLSGIQITKLDAITNKPLKDASFTVTRPNGEKIGTFRTGADGMVVVPDLDEGTYIVSEISAPTGYQLDETPKNVNVVSGRLATVEFTNKPYSGIQIIKTDAITRNPLAYATFTVDRSSGERIGVYRTDTAGQILIPDLSEGTYIISETAAPNGYMLDQTPKTVTVISGRVTTVEFTNKPYSGIEIIKIDAVTKVPLQGATFTVERSDGAKIGTYKTDSAGKVLVSDIPEGTYIVAETSAPNGYMLNETPKTVNVVSGKLASVEFSNAPYGSLIIKKTDEITGRPLAGAHFTVKHQNGAAVGDFITDNGGAIAVPNLEPGWYMISEIKAPTGYHLDSAAKTIEVTSHAPTTIGFTNRPYSGIVIVKLDAITNQPLQGAAFTVTKSNGERVGTFRTEADGKILISDLTEGVYVVGEITAPDGYQLDETPKNVTVVSGKLATVEFNNKPYSGIEIIKTDAVTHNPLAGATFVVERSNGERIGSYKTDMAGKIIVPNLTEGTYIVSETIAPDGYHLNETPKTAVVVSGKLTTVEFANKPFSGIQVIKLDAINNSPLSGATFTVERDTGEKIGTYKTDMSGKILVSDLSEGTYIVSETIAPDGYTRDEAPKTVIVKTGKITTIEFRNKPLSGIEIVKIDAITKAPLMGATFVVERPNSEKIGTFKTDAAGKVIVSNLTEGNYVVSEIIAPDGYQLDEVPKTVVVTSGKLTSVEFTNKPHSGIQIIKLDAQTKAPLTGATFLVERDNGERIGSYKTDSTGKIIVSNLPEGTYIVSESAAPSGYILDEAPKTVIVKSGKITTVEFFNKALSGLKIIKLNSVTRNPIEGVEFTVAKMSGETVTNEFYGTTFKTDRTGQIYIPQLEDGYYTVTETRSADGYILDGEPKTVLIQSVKPTVLEVLNTPMSGLLIVKTDAATGKPLAGVVFDVRRADGQFVAGSILDGNQPNTEANSPNKTTSPNGDITGSYTTDSNGRILINGLSAGEYHVVERKALDGYELDTTVHAATVTPGKLTTLQITNKQKAGLRLVKVDSITKKGIYNVEFMVFDANNKVVGTYYTDNNGLIDFSGILSEGRYTIRETRAAAGYYLDEIPKTVEFVSGKMTEIVWTNVPQMAQIQILKKSGDDNEVNSLPAGTPLAGAVFEAYDYKTGNLVDRFISGSDGRAVSAPLPLGRYIIKEVKAPQWYKVSDKTLDVDLEFATQIVKLEYLNYAANTGVTIRKTGPAECMPGDTISYTIREVQNTGTTPLTDFYWRDTLPVDAVRLTKIVTGSYNQALKYKIIAITNKGDTLVIADNLSTTKNNVIDCSNASLGLKNDEFVTSFALVFGTVKAGFAQVEQPQVFVKVMSTLNNQYQFANKVDVAGKYGTEWVAGNSSTLCTVYKKQSPLPRTGY